jgi:glycine/D-amino acid oxidase-like deaminating enzyme
MAGDPETSASSPSPGVAARTRELSAVSFWLGTAGDLTPRLALDGDLNVDVAIVGAGYTGLWTAYYLAAADPALRIAVIEAEIAGFGASGRNGGWCSALFPQSIAALTRRHGRDRAVALHNAMVATVDEVGRVAAAEKIDCDYAKGGTVVLARTPVQLERARATARDELDLTLLSAEEARERCGATNVLGGTYTPNCAAIHPAKLVRGLARAVEERGVKIYERSRVTHLAPGIVETPHGTVRAAIVVRATEGYTPRLPGQRRTLAPVYSLMVATEPLPAEFWSEAGLGHRETFSDYRHLIVYGQRTADDRLAFGGRGAPYHFGSTVDPAHDLEPRVFAELGRVLAELFPTLEPVPIAYRWGGPLGVPRDWHASVGLNRERGLAWGGGYVGDGVGTSNLAGRTLADLITGADTELTRLPWVGHRSRRWEPEPLRWLGANATLRLMTAADNEESRTGRPSRRAAMFARLLGTE